MSLVSYALRFEGLDQANRGSSRISASSSAASGVV